MKLLTETNPKTAKGRAKGYLTTILHLAPHTLSGRNVCPSATAGCAAACLNTAGHGGIALTTKGDNSVQRARRARTDFYFDDRAGFLTMLERELHAHVKRAGRLGLVPCARLNGTSDLRFERSGIMDVFPALQFYDYTKIPNRRGLPTNYHLTYSLAEGERNWKGHLVALENGYSVAVVLRGAGDSRRPLPFPATWGGRALVDGDTDDLRFLDPPSVYVGLRAKGRALRDVSGFVHDVDANPPWGHGENGGTLSAQSSQRSSSDWQSVTFSPRISSGSSSSSSSSEGSSSQRSGG